MSELTPEDSLRLNVLLAGEIEAIRIDENAMAVRALTPQGEAAVKLHPTGRADQYLRLVREVLAGHAIGSPGGYPLFIQRWTRMGQARDKGLDRLLLLGEPEAVVSVAYSNGLTDELARRAWWAMQSADNARRMLERECVVQGAMGRILAEYLIEHLPFENAPHTIIDTVRIVLQPGLTNDAARQRLWHKGAHDNAYYVGFLERLPDDLPDQAASRADLVALQPKLAALSARDNPYARLLERVLSGAGQAFLATSEEVLRRPADQDVVIALLNVLAGYFAALRPADCADNQQPTALREFLDVLPVLAEEAGAMQVLSCMDATVAAPILAQTTASGTVMRKKLEPVTTPILRQLATLRGIPFIAATPRRPR
ncbi:MAG: sulfur reduction protein DsrS [Betaproteobacteria bacterium]|nr:sulfur reduction protein DsrS [Betaproteobacteria bacterium]